ncbi:MAG: hypothetical protein FWE36_08345 [Erysipelotrichales bacterium]|nr:hypothetical protein [Erysipelotrichales bacterium]
MELVQNVSQFFSSDFDPNLFTYIFMFWALFTFLIYGVLRGLDKQYKNVYKFEDFYNLEKSKWLFCFYNHKSGKISKHVFWLNIFGLILILSSLVINVVFAINRSTLTGGLSGIFTLSLILFLFIMTIPGMHYHKKHQKIKDSEKTED